MKYDSKGNPMCPVRVGERLVVLNRPEKAIVDNVVWVDSEQRWRIALDWGSFGMSRVWSTDEGTIWTKFSELN